MGMRMVYQTAEQQDRGFMTAYNKSDKAIVVKLYGVNGPMKPIELEPGEEIQLDAGYRRVLKKISPYLKEGRKPSNFEPEPFPASVPDQQRRQRERVPRESVVVMPKKP